MITAFFVFERALTSLMLMSANSPANADTARARARTALSFFISDICWLMLVSVRFSRPHREACRPFELTRGGLLLNIDRFSPQIFKYLNRAHVGHETNLGDNETAEHASLDRFWRGRAKIAA